MSVGARMIFDMYTKSSVYPGKEPSVNHVRMVLWPWPGWYCLALICSVCSCSLSTRAAGGKYVALQRIGGSRPTGIVELQNQFADMLCPVYTCLGISAFFLDDEDICTLDASLPHHYFYYENAEVLYF